MSNMAQSGAQTCSGHSDSVPDLPEEVIGQLRRYVSVFTDLKGRAIAAKQFGVSIATLTNWISHKHVGRSPQLFGELFDSKLDRLMMETNAPTATISRRRKIAAEPMVFDWFLNLLKHRGIIGLSELLDVDRKTTVRRWSEA